MADHVQRPRIGSQPAMAAPPMVTKPSRWRAVARWREPAVAYGFLVPSLFGVTIFLLLPVVAVFIISFYRWSLLGSPHFVGLANFTQLVHDRDTIHSLLVTCYYVVLDIPVQTALALGVALLLNQKVPGAKVFRVAFVVPWLATPVVMGIIWQWLLDPSYGAVNALLGQFGISGPAWLSNSNWALPTIVGVNFWQWTGYISLFFLAGLQNIPEPLYEAARTDGASPWYMFRHITLPLLNPTTYFVVVTEVIGSFQVFDTIYVMTNGGPGDATNVLNFAIYTQAFRYFAVGYASAISVLLFLVLLVSTMLLTLFFRHRTTFDMS